MSITIAVDAMGGDHGPQVVVPASLNVLKLHPELKLILVGRQEIIEPLLLGLDDLKDRIEVHHASQQVTMDESPAIALRYKKDSSMRVCINLVKNNIAQACVSAGNTGALMATARFVLKTLPGIDRPAIMARLPTLTGKEVRILDLGANVDSSAEQLYQFGVMGSVVASAVDNIPNPRVGLINIGEEQIKGNGLVKETAQLLSQNSALNYIGYVEGNAVFAGVADVVVCDGFVGNVMLKSVEGISKLISHFFKEEFQRGIFGKLAALAAYPYLSRAKKRMDPRERNGASLLGLEGIVIKSHGGADIMAFAVAIEEAVIEAKKNIPELIRQRVSLLLEESNSQEPQAPLI